MKYFIDTEFIEGFREPIFTKRHHFIDLISIGIVAEDGRIYYAISKEFNPDEASDWVKENVLYPIMLDYGYHKSLSNLHGCLSYNKGAVKWIQKYKGKSNTVIAKEIYDFINPHLDNGSGGYVNKLLESVDYVKSNNTFCYPPDDKCPFFAWRNKPDFYGYYADYDWIVFCKLWGTMMDLPQGFPMYCRDLKQMLDEKVTSLFSGKEYGDKRDEFEWKLNYVKGLEKYPKQSNEHNALSDADWNKKLYDFIVQH